MRIILHSPFSILHSLRYTSSEMADRDDTILDRAEGIARRVLERLGAKLDRKLESPISGALTHRAVGDLATRVEQAVESSLQPDKSGLKRVAANRLEVLLTYEESSEINDQYLDALASELSTAAQEYINNRRYETTGPVQLEVRRDLFAKSATIKATFDPELEAITQEGKSPARAQTAPGAGSKQGPATRTIRLTLAGGKECQLEITVNEGSKSIGRTVGNALRIDDQSVSRLHCSLALRSSGEIVVSDLGSANGTSVNRQPLGPTDARQLSVGDVITVGDVDLTVVAID